MRAAKGETRARIWPAAAALLLVLLAGSWTSAAASIPSPIDSLAAPSPATRPYAEALAAEPEPAATTDELPQLAAEPPPATSTGRAAFSLLDRTPCPEPQLEQLASPRAPDDVASYRETRVWGFQLAERTCAWSPGEVSQSRQEGYVEAGGETAVGPLEFGYQGMPRDPETGLIYFRNRYYDPELGRFITADPKGYVDGPSMYAFEKDDPANGSDPMGWLRLSDIKGEPTASQIADLDLAPWEVKAILGSQSVFKAEDTRTNPDGAEINQARAKYVLLFRNKPFREYVDASYQLLRGVNPVHYSVEAGAAIESGREPVMGTKVSRGDKAAELLGYMAVQWVLHQAIPREGPIPRTVVPRDPPSDWPLMSGMLRDAAAGKGNFGIGAATSEQAQIMGEAWVGPRFSVASDGKTLISADGLRQFRPPSYKPNLKKIQANFEARPPGLTKWQSNAHLDIQE